MLGSQLNINFRIHLIVNFRTRFICLYDQVVLCFVEDDFKRLQERNSVWLTRYIGCMLRSVNITSGLVVLLFEPSVKIWDTMIPTIVTRR